MKTFNCRCEQRLYFEDTRCPKCRAPVGWCPKCDDLVALDSKGNGLFLCKSNGCEASLRFCKNATEYDACNRCVEAGSDAEYCDMCEFDDARPDLTDPVKLECFQRLQVAKRRVLNQFQMIGLPPYDSDTTEPVLSFDFKADSIPTEMGWRPMGVETVYTGHSNGKITINIREADSVERERLRIQFGESYRTLTGHFRHELAHYLWDAWISGSEHEAEFIEVFGDHSSPTYSEALQHYYKNGPAKNWEQEYVSAYASMHPFEDWAETTAVILNIHATLETAKNYNMLPPGPEPTEPGYRLDQFIFLGDFLNEISREMGLLDAMPAAIPPPVRRKMTFIRRLVERELDENAKPTH